jgi:hypothetical protein
MQVTDSPDCKEIRLVHMQSLFQPHRRLVQIIVICTVRLSYTFEGGTAECDSPIGHHHHCVMRPLAYVASGVCRWKPEKRISTAREKILGIPAARFQLELVWGVLSSIGLASRSTVPAVILCRALQASCQDNMHRAQCSNGYELEIAHEDRTLRESEAKGGGELFKHTIFTSYVGCMTPSFYDIICQNTIS